MNTFTAFLADVDEHEQLPENKPILLSAEQSKAILNATKSRNVVFSNNKPIQPGVSILKDVNATSKRPCVKKQVVFQTASPQVLKRPSSGPGSESDSGNTSLTEISTMLSKLHAAGYSLKKNDVNVSPAKLHTVVQTQQASSTQNSKTNMSPSVPIEFVGIGCKKVYKIVENNGQVTLFPSAKPEEANAEHMACTIASNESAMDQVLHTHQSSCTSDKGLEVSPVKQPTVYVYNYKINL